MTEPRTLLTEIYGFSPSFPQENGGVTPLWRHPDGTHMAWSDCIRFLVWKGHVIEPETVSTMQVFPGDRLKVEGEIYTITAVQMRILKHRE